MTLNSQQYANLADHSYGRDMQGNAVDLNSLVGKSVKIEGVQYMVLAHADRPSGYQGTIYQRVDTGDIVVAHRGTEFGREPIKDGLLADGGMVFGRVNSQAADAIELTRTALREAQKFSIERGGSPPEVTVTGHSLGGTLAQISAHHFDLRGETFNAFGAASLGYRIPEGGDRMLNHVMAADAVSSASPHYGQVRIHAGRGEIEQLQASGYHNNRLLDMVTPDLPLLASVNGSHMMHNFLNVDGDGRLDVSALGDAGMRTRAEDNARMIQNYRGDVGALRAAASLSGDAVDVLRRGPLMEPGEPARLESRGDEHAPPRNRRSSVNRDGDTPSSSRADMRDANHPANDKYRQAYTGVMEIERSLGRTPDGASERLAAALTAAGAGLSSISQVALSRDGSRAFAVDAGPAEVRNRVHVDVAAAVQRPVEASTQDWQLASQHMTRQQQEQLAREQTNPEMRGPAMA
jgi:hypothetical protein